MVVLLVVVGHLVGLLDSAAWSEPFGGRHLAGPWPIFQPLPWNPASFATMASHQELVEEPLGQLLESTPCSLAICMDILPSKGLVGGILQEIEGPYKHNIQKLSHALLFVAHGAMLFGCVLGHNTQKLAGLCATKPTMWLESLIN